MIGFTDASTDSTPTLVVGIGASAGGLQAFKELMAVLDADSGMAYVLIQHLAPEHESLLSELLAPRISIPVRDAEQGDTLRPNVVYVIKPGCALAVRKGTIELSEPTLERGVRLPVDHLFRSLAKEYGARSVGIVLSGAGSDGTSGLREIKMAGGITIAQEPETSRQIGMPQSAIDSGNVEMILPIAEIPLALQRFASLPKSALVGAPSEDVDWMNEESDNESEPDSPARRSDLNDQDLRKLQALVATQTDFDLSIYKPRTIRRRVTRRMLLAGFDDVSAYLEYLRTHDAEQKAMVRDLLISVTSFFRDPSAFTALRENVIEPILAGRKPGEQMRVWVAGCATGEEAYSIGMLILDAAAERKKPVNLQIFATDIDQVALNVAREGVYPPSVAEHISARRLASYFEPLEGRGYRVRPVLRDTISFALHDLTKDPPFSRMDLVTCRNVMIYFTPAAQQHVLGALHFALCAGSYLFLSTSEAPGARPELFTTTSKSGHIYQKLGTSRPVLSGRSGEKDTRLAGRVTHRREGGDRNEPHTPREGNDDPARRFALQEWVPPSAIVNDAGHVVFLHGELEPYLQFPQGDNPRFDLNAMLRSEIATRTLGALYRCRKDDKTVAVMARVETHEDLSVRITAKPAATLGTGCVMLTFESVESGTVDSGNTTDRQSIADTDVSDAVVRRLDEELQATREDLRNTVEELESTNEELRSSNEESMSMNEELQSSNEELEATTEELRSLNEELSTVNAQLRDKIEQLVSSNNDVRNFFSSARVPTVFLDEHLRIKRFTPAAARLLGINESDVGRFTGDIARELLQHDLEQDARSVLTSLDIRSCELRTGEGLWFSRQVLPYLTENRSVEGVVVTLTDITDLKLATEQLSVRESQHRVIAKLGIAALGKCDLQEFMDKTVQEVVDTLEVDFCKILELQPGGGRLLLRAGVGWNEGLVGSSWVDTGSNSQAGYTLNATEPVIVENLSEDARFSGPELLITHEVTSGISCIIRYGEQIYGVIGGHTRNERRFTKEDADFLQAIANVIGTIINNHEDRWRRLLDSLIARTLTDSDDVESMLETVLSVLTSELDCDAGELWWQDEGQQFSRRLVHSIPQPSQRDVKSVFAERGSPSRQELIKRVNDSGRAQWATDIGEPDFFTSKPSIKAIGITSAFGFPVSEGGTVEGIITLYSRRRMFANDLFLRTLEIVGASIGSALNRLRHEEREERLAAITSSSHDAIFSRDIDGKITEWLPGAERLFGYTADEMTGNSLDPLIPPDQLDIARSAGERILAGEVMEPFETRRQTQDGSVIEVSVVSSALRSSNGSIIGITSTERDISRLKTTERQLLSADRQKNEFLAMLGHELRNPLSGIRAAAELLDHPTMADPDLQRAQQVIERQSAHMSKLLDGLLDVSRIVNGKISLEIGSVDLIKACRDVLSDMSQTAAEAEVTMTGEYPSQPVWAEVDSTRLVQILDNVLSNALRYTPPGGSVVLGLYQKDDMAVISVSDDGIGIEESVLPRIFDVFWQSEQSFDRARGGLGLGLSLVRTITELHGGRIDAYSEGSGRGAEFVLQLPLSKSPAPEKKRKTVEPSGATRSPGPTRILIIEDNKDSADMISRVLKRQGHTVTTVHDGASGITWARQHLPDVVLCDLGLPDGITGYDIARELSESDSTSSIGLIALTGYGEPEVKQRCIEVGFQCHLTKPISIERLVHAVNNAASAPA